MYLHVLLASATLYVHECTTCITLDNVIMHSVPGPADSSSVESSMSLSAAVVRAGPGRGSCWEAGGVMGRPAGLEVRAGKRD